MTPIPVLQGSVFYSLASQDRNGEWANGRNGDKEEDFYSDPRSPAFSTVKTHPVLLLMADR
jgi:hypothetical protein